MTHRGPFQAPTFCVSVIQAKALGPLSQGRELEKSRASPGGCPARLLSLQAPEGVDSPGSSPSSSPLVVSMAKETHLGWWYTLLFALNLFPRGVGHIFTSPSAQEFSTATHLHDCHLWVSLEAVRIYMGAGWPYYHSPRPKLTLHDVLFTPKQ